MPGVRSSFAATPGISTRPSVGWSRAAASPFAWMISLLSQSSRRLTAPAGTWWARKRASQWSRGPLISLCCTAAPMSAVSPPLSRSERVQRGVEEVREERAQEEPLAVAALIKPVAERAADRAATVEGHLVRRAHRAGDLGHGVQAADHHGLAGASRGALVERRRRRAGCEQRLDVVDDRGDVPDRLVGVGTLPTGGARQASEHGVVRWKLAPGAAGPKWRRPEVHEARLRRRQALAFEAERRERGRPVVDDQHVGGGQEGDRSGRGAQERRDRAAGSPCCGSRRGSPAGPWPSRRPAARP